MSTDYFAQCAAGAYDTWERNYRRCKREAANRNDQFAKVPLCSHHHDAIVVDAVLPIQEALRDARQQLQDVETALSMRRLDEHLAWRDGVKERSLAYFMRCGEFVKIGASSHPLFRLETIRRTGGVLSPQALDLSKAELVATERGGFDRERELHQQFKHLRHTGEWFTEAPELTEYINALEAAA